MSKQNYYWLALAIIIQLALSAGTGALSGYFVAKTYRPAVQPLQGFIVPGLLTATSTVTSTLPEPVTATSVRLVPLSMVEPASRVVPDDLRNRRSPLALVMSAKKVGTTETYKELGRAVAVTSDGWFVAPGEVIETQKLSELRLVFENQVYAPAQGIRDDSSGTVFFKLSARDLPAAAFAKNLDDKVGYALWQENFPGAYLASSLVSANSDFEAKVYSSDTPARRFVAAGILAPAEIGSPLWDGSGSLLGLSVSSDSGRIDLIPATLISASLQSLISDGRISHASLGVTAINLSRVLGSETQKGLQIRSVNKGSAAEKAGLKINDVILEVEHDIIDSSSELGDILAEYKPGATVSLRVLRGTESLDLSAALGTQVTSRPLP